MALLQMATSDVVRAQLQAKSIKCELEPAAPLVAALAKQHERNNFAQLLQSDSLKPNVRKSPTGAMVRSIFFPGWGQFYNGKSLKALIVFGVEAGFIGAAIYYNQKAQDDQESAEGRAFYADQRNTNYWRTGVVILLSMLDAYVDAHLSDFDESPDLSLRARPVANPATRSVLPELHLSLRFSF